MVIDLSQQTRTCVFFVATPLHYLAARAVASHFEPGARHVLVYYKRSMAPIVKATAWDAVTYMPWPRFEPLPGPFGRFRRLRENLREVSLLLGTPTVVSLHSPVFDTEAINYFLNGIPKLRPGTHIEARLLPDGILNTRRHPLPLIRRIGQCIRKLRRLAAPELDYRCFSGDRTGSDASFVDRIYVLQGLPHQYSAAKAMELPPLAPPLQPATDRAGARRALVVGQPLHGHGLMNAPTLGRLTRDIGSWLSSNGIENIDYKPHPRDPRNELCMEHYTLLQLDEPLEIHLGRVHYDLIVGVSSTALLLARQICPASTRVVSFGLAHHRFKHPEDRARLHDLFRSAGVEIH